MTIVDRYLLFQFLKIFLVCFISFAGLFIVIHVFSNLDEVVKVTGEEGGLQSLLLEFYGPRVLDFFNRMAGVLILVSAVFAISMMQRRRETTATEAAGITKARLVMPILIAAVGIIALAAVSRELYIPQYRSTLVRSLTNWTKDGAVVMHHQKDVVTGILVQGKELHIDESKITEIQLTLPRTIKTQHLDIRADSGVIQPADAERNSPVGILLKKGVEPVELLTSDSLSLNEQTVVFTRDIIPG